MSSAGGQGKVPGAVRGGRRSQALRAGGEVAPDQGQGVHPVCGHHQQEGGGGGGEDEVKHWSWGREDLDLLEHLTRTSLVSDDPEHPAPVCADVEEVPGNSSKVSHPRLDDQPGKELTLS